ncbi:hypothetical protein ACFZDJ_25925 [Streptomyces sp. NPDC007896]|uniref:hypothetical protein n=1 Tax=Streptomyces sp. NPDC007896 TaxID=3364784 RepID=UPI0036E63194
MDVRARGEVGQSHADDFAVCVDRSVLRNVVRRHLVPGGDVLDRRCRAVGDLDGSSPRYISEEKKTVIDGESSGI